MQKNAKMFTKNDIIVQPIRILFVLEIITEDVSFLIYVLKRSYRAIRFFNVFYSDSS